MYISNSFWVLPTTKRWSKYFLANFRLFSSSQPFTLFFIFLGWKEEKRWKTSVFLENAKAGWHPNANQLPDRRYAILKTKLVLFSVTVTTTYILLSKSVKAFLLHFLARKRWRITQVLPNSALWEELFNFCLTFTTWNVSFFRTKVYHIIQLIRYNWKNKTMYRIDETKGNPTGIF